MRITAIEDLHCDAGWRDFSYLKISTDEGITGWSEFNECYGSQGLSHVIRLLGQTLIGRDPRPIGRISADLAVLTRQAPLGVNQQAIAAIENALLDIKAKALGVPVYSLFGGPYRDRLTLYWSHCGTYRFRHAAAMGKPPIRSLEDVTRLGREVAERGFKALKCNIYRFDAERPYVYGIPTTDPAETFHPEMNVSSAVVQAIREELAAFREGAGPAMGLLMDLNFNFKADGFLRVARAVEEFDMTWLELDTFDPGALASIRRGARVPIASLETIYGREHFKPFFEQYAVDVAIVDVIWNGMLESLRIAAMAEPYQVNVAPHNFYGHLCSYISANFCAAIPNFRIMEIDIDDVPWKDELVTNPPVIRDGHFLLPSAPGWGTDINEEAVRAHPPKRAH
jgi:galactonate dehydratase